jgi:hypothetical protein
MSIPVIFIHNGNQDYFKTVFQQACKLNTYVFILGAADRTPMAHFHTGHYFELAGEFAKHYEHLSTNGYEIELMCFQRWFILQDFMVKHGMDRCFHLDSDTMLYANVDEEYPNTNNLTSRYPTDAAVTGPFSLSRDSASSAISLSISTKTKAPMNMNGSQHITIFAENTDWTGVFVT